MRMFSLRSACCLLIPVMVLGGCKKAPKRKREEIVAEASRERRRVDNFVYALRKVIEWRQSQPAADSEAARLNLIKGVTRKLDQVSADDLPKELEKAWKRMLKAWKTLSKDPVVDQDLIDEGSAAAAELNRLLVLNGYPDLRL